jgi:hypothetical protein
MKVPDRRIRRYRQALCGFRIAVAPSNMTDEEVLAEAHADGFELIERICAGMWAVGSGRGDDDRWPCFLEERQAISRMRDRLTRGRVFV